MDIQQTINPGATVYGADGEKVGTVATYSGQYIVVEKGFFFPKDYYIPVGFITERSADAVYLSVTKDDALNQGWDQQPAESWETTQSGTGTQYGTTGTTGYTAEQDTLTVPVHGLLTCRMLTNDVNTHPGGEPIRA